MSQRQVRMKVRGGRLEPLEALPLEEGSELLVVIDVPDRAPEAKAGHLVLPKWSLGVRMPLTRRAIYEDAG